MPALYFGSDRGRYVAVLTGDGYAHPRGSRGHEADGTGRHVHAVTAPGDRRARCPRWKPALRAPRTRTWYGGGAGAGRVFSPVQIDGVEPVRDPVAAVVYDDHRGVMACLPPTFGLLIYSRTQRMSARGAAASSWTMRLSVRQRPLTCAAARRDGRSTLRSPADSANPVIREAFVARRRCIAQRREASVAVDTGSHRFHRRRARAAGAAVFGEGARWPALAAGGGRTGGRITAGAAGAEDPLTPSGCSVFGAAVAWWLARAYRAPALEQLDLGLLHRRGCGAGSGHHHRASAAVHQFPTVLHDSAAQIDPRYRQQVAHDAQQLRLANENLSSGWPSAPPNSRSSVRGGAGYDSAKAAFWPPRRSARRSTAWWVWPRRWRKPLLDAAEQRDYPHTPSASPATAAFGHQRHPRLLSKIESAGRAVALRAAVEEACDIAAPRAREKARLLIDILDHERVAICLRWHPATSRDCGRCHQPGEITP